MQREVEHHFVDWEQQRAAATLGMWAFIAQEVLFFGGGFTGYAIYRLVYAEAFRAASAHLDGLLGGINTAVLIASSLTVVLAVHAGRHGGRVGRWLWATLALGGTFLVIKAFEYAHKFHEGLVPGAGFRLAGG